MKACLQSVGIAVTFLWKYSSIFDTPSPPHRGTEPLSDLPATSQSESLQWRLRTPMSKLRLSPSEEQDTRHLRHLFSLLKCQLDDPHPAPKKDRPLKTFRPIAPPSKCNNNLRLRESKQRKRPLRRKGNSSEGFGIRTSRAFTRNNNIVYRLFFLEAGVRHGLCRGDPTHRWKKQNLKIDEGDMPPV